jgi:hypothetical protein
LVLAWDLPLTGNGGIPILGYKLYRDDGRGAPVDQEVWDGSDQPNVKSVTVTGLTSGLSYRFQVSAFNGIGESSKSVALVQPAGVVPDPPVLELNPDVAESKTAIALKWSPPANTGGTAVTSYVIEYDNGGNSDFKNSRTYTAKVRQALFQGFSEGRVHRFLIYAENIVGRSNASTVFRKQVCKTPGTVASFAAVNHTNTTVTLTWQPPQDLGCTDVIGVVYKIYVRQGANAFTFAYEGGRNELSTELQGLNAGAGKCDLHVTHAYEWTLALSLCILA